MLSILECLFIYIRFILDGKTMFNNSLNNVHLPSVTTSHVGRELRSEGLNS